MQESISHTIHQAVKGDKVAQHAFYDQYKEKLLAVCQRYLPIREDAEDVFIEAWVKIFDKLNTYKGEGSIEGWLRKIMVNESLMFLRKKNNQFNTLELKDQIIESEVDTEEDHDQMTFEEILSMMEELPLGYRTIFNLYIFEEMKHREIAELLNISINTSKSQLILAKRRMVEIYTKRQN